MWCLDQYVPRAMCMAHEKKNNHRLEIELANAGLTSQTLAHHWPIVDKNAVNDWGVGIVIFTNRTDAALCVYVCTW